VPISPFIARDAMLARLLRLRDRDHLAQPLLLVGPEGSGKEGTALEFARLLNCRGPQACRDDAPCESCAKAASFQHPDIRLIAPAPAAVTEAEARALLEQKIAEPFARSPESATAQVNIGDPESPGPLSIRSLIRFTRVRAFQGPWKVAIVVDAHRLGGPAANAFLKTLEEPPAATVIMLTSTGTEGMLPTILSRCQKLRFEPWPEADLAARLAGRDGADPEAAAWAARLAQGNARLAWELLQPESRALADWAGLLFAWIADGARGQAAIAADELHRGAYSHAVEAPPARRGAGGEQGAAERRARAIRLCELLNLHYSDALACREASDRWQPRFPGAAATVRRVAAARPTGALLADMARIDAATGAIDRNLNIGLVMAVLFEGLRDHG
jgi:DNA polymerase-3 subunit delta'